MRNQRVTILGSGPAGLTAAVYAARAGLQPLVIQGMQPGGQLTTTTEVENFPGFSKGILGPELMDEMQKQAERFGTEFLSDVAESVDLTQRPFIIKTGSGVISTETLIISTGANAKLLGLPSETKLMGRGVSVCATCDGFFFKDKDVVVVGGGDAALEEAMTLSKLASSVTIIHRRDVFRASKIMVDRARNNPKIRYIFDSVVTEIRDVAQMSVVGVQVRNVKTGEVQEVPTDGVFIAIGHTPNTELFKDQLAMNPLGYLIVDGVRTSVPGVFAAGDAADPRFRQAIFAAGNGCAAALEAQWFLEQQEHAS